MISASREHQLDHANDVRHSGLRSCYVNVAEAVIDWDTGP